MADSPLLMRKGIAFKAQPAHLNEGKRGWHRSSTAGKGGCFKL